MLDKRRYSRSGRWIRRSALAASAAVVVLGAVAGVSAVSGPVRPPYREWTDTFTGPAGSAPSPANWSFETGGGGWGNGELECYTDARANSALDGHGNLIITAVRDPGHKCSDGRSSDYTSARLTTRRLHSSRYGTMTVRAKLPNASGTWPAFWALGDDHETVGWPASGEIDVVEGAGASPIVHGSVHGPNTLDPKTAYDLSGQYVMKTPMSAGFHDYSATWSPTQISFAVDGDTYRTVTKAEVQASGRWVFDHPFYLMLNVAVGGNFPGYPDASATWPQAMTVDRVTLRQP